MLRAITRWNSTSIASKHMRELAKDPHFSKILKDGHMEAKFALENYPLNPVSRKELLKLFKAEQEARKLSVY